jgi:hypothetical protein
LKNCARPVVTRSNPIEKKIKSFMVKTLRVVHK